MPGMNGRGPLGKGPLSGGQRGFCNQTERDTIDQSQENGEDTVPKQDRGFGRCQQGGAGRGAGKGQGRGQGRGGNR